MSFPVRKIRTIRDTRNTLKPTVADFSEVVIGRYTPNQEAKSQQIWTSIVTTLRENHEAINKLQGGKPKKSKLLRENPNEIENDKVDDDLCVNTVAKAQAESANYQRPHSTVTYSALEQSAHNHIPASFESPSSSSYGPAEVHRRHVVKSARLRSRLGGNKQMKRMDSRASVMSTVWPDSKVTSPRVRPQSSEFIGHLTPRSRPATTGRYFDSSNGLCRTSTARLSTKSRPQSSRLQSGIYDVSRPLSSRPLSSRPSSSRSQTARPSTWMGPGLRIQQMKLNIREAEIVGGFNSRPFF